MIQQNTEYSQNKIIYYFVGNTKNRALNLSVFRHDPQYYEGFLRIENFFLPCTRPQNFGVHLPVPQLWLHRLQFQCNSTRILADSLQSMITSAKNHHMRLSVTVKTETLHLNKLKVVR